MKFNTIVFLSLAAGGAYAATLPGAATTSALPATSTPATDKKVGSGGSEPVVTGDHHKTVDKHFHGHGGSFYYRHECYHKPGSKGKHYWHCKHHHSHHHHHHHPEAVNNVGTKGPTGTVDKKPTTTGDSPESSKSGAAADKKILRRDGPDTNPQDNTASVSVEHHGSSHGGNRGGNHGGNRGGNRGGNHGSNRGGNHGRRN